jgi:SOS response regulatory protein OraA/RecX
LTESQKTVTAFRERRRGRVEVELDGRPWRSLPIEAVARAGLAVGRPLDRETARTLARELRRSRALARATRALTSRDRSRRGLDERLARAGTPETARAEALATLEVSGLVDDARVARSRARRLAERGYGDAAIRADLEREGLGAEDAAEALAELEPERERALRLLGAREPEPRTLRRLAARGFDPETIAGLPGFADSA